MVGKRAQASLEQVVVFAIALVVVTIVVFLAMASTSDNAASAVGRETIDKLSRTSEYVNSLGPGTKTEVLIEVPKGAKYLKIDNNIIHMKLVSSSGQEYDIYSTVKANVYGNIQLSEGRTKLTVEKLEDGRVLISANYLLCHPVSIIKTATQGSSVSFDMLISNVGPHAITHIAGSSGGQLAHYTSLNPAYIDLLQVGDSRIVSVVINVPVNLDPGSYRTTINFSSENGISCSSEVALFVTRVLGMDTEGPLVSSLITEPSELDPFTQVNVFATGDDTTTGNSNIAMCQIEIDHSGIWMDMLPVETEYNTLPVQSVMYSLGMLSPGRHTVKVRCIDSAGNLGQERELDLMVISDTEGPLVTRLEHLPSTVYPDTIVSIFATGDDTSTGNSNISMCEIRIDQGNWYEMMPDGSDYGTSPVQDTAYTISSLSVGTHLAEVRCKDVQNNIGPIQSHQINVIARDRVGPIVKNLTVVQTIDGRSDVPFYTTNIRIRAIGDDTSTGNSNISMCEYRIDNSQWKQMNAVGSYNTSPVQEITVDISSVTLGPHLIEVRCIDEKQNIGEIASKQAKFTKDIAFLIVSNPLNSYERRWINWFASNPVSSAEGFSWSKDYIWYGNVTNNQSFSLSNYKIVVMASYVYSNTAFYNALKNYKDTQNGYIVLLGASMYKGVAGLGIGTGDAMLSTTKSIKITGSHYVTQGFSIGSTVTIASSSAYVKYHTQPSVPVYATYSSYSSRKVLFNGNRVIAWGMEDPLLSTSQGNTINIRVFDYALLQSQIRDQ